MRNVLTDLSDDVRGLLARPLFVAGDGRPAAAAAAHGVRAGRAGALVGGFIGLGALALLYGLAGHDLFVLAGAALLFRPRRVRDRLVAGAACQPDRSFRGTAA